MKELEIDKEWRLDTPRPERMRAYEDDWRHVLPPRSYVVVRVDGRAFHTLTRGMERPFDAFFITAMNDVAAALCAEIQGARFAYVQSDEVSVLLTDFGVNAEMWFGGVVQKMTSIAAAAASNAFNVRPSSFTTRRPAQFDARVFTLPSRVEVFEYLRWRQADCYRNAVSMIAEARFSSQALLGKTVNQRVEMLDLTGGPRIENYPLGARYGRVIERVDEETTVTYTRRDTGEEVKLESVLRRRWEVQVAPVFDYAADGFLERNVPTRDEDDADGDVDNVADFSDNVAEETTVTYTRRDTNV